MVYRMSKICALDIDGVLNNYPKCWVQFVNEKEGADFKTLNDMKDNLVYSKYKQLKDDYRSSGYKRYIPTREGAAYFTRQLRTLGYQIIIITSRPFEKYPQLREDTLYWLKNNGFEFDVLLHSKYKHMDIIAEYPTMEFMVEDNRDFAISIARLGYKVFLMDNEYNKGKILIGMQRVNEFKEILINL